MSTGKQSRVYNELVNLLAENAPADKLLKFHLSKVNQRRLDDLLSRNRNGSLTAQEEVELDAFEQFEHMVRLLKARVRAK